jgi:hypothetical protein
MKRYAFDATRGEMFEIASGAWVAVDDARAAVEQLMARIERVTFTTVQGQTLSSCTLPDVEVLKEMDAVPTRTLESINPLDDWAGPARAELARRRLRP